ncbi:MAG: MarR family transcriptional regulator, partial [Kurthia sp.]|nr:MarR family transcriptional regulator [Kurthia sp.]
RGEMSLTSIWKYLNVEAPTITRTVARLEQLGLLQRKKGDDLREKIVSLTEEGKKKFEEVKVTVSAYEDQFAKGLTEEEQEQLKGLLRKMKG